VGASRCSVSFTRRCVDHGLVVHCRGQARGHGRVMGSVLTKRKLPQQKWTWQMARRQGGRRTPVECTRARVCEMPCEMPRASSRAAGSQTARMVYGW
jgi:hypothetical protein